MFATLPVVLFLSYYEATTAINSEIPSGMHEKAARVSQQDQALRAWLMEFCPDTMGLDNIETRFFDYAGIPIAGLGATRDFAQGETVLCVPELCQLSLGKPLEFDRIKTLTSKYEECDRMDTAVPLFIADEMRKGSDSFFKPFNDMVPTEEELEEYHPAFLRSSARRAFANCKSSYSGGDCSPPWYGDDSFVVHHWDKKYNTLAACYERYVELLASGEFNIPMGEAGRDKILRPMTLDFYYYSLVLWESRSFSLKGRVPMVEMINSRIDFNLQTVKGTRDESDFCLIAAQPIAKGEELTLDYNGARKSPYQMFSEYGFAFPESDHAKGIPECRDLGPDSDVHKCQSPVACKLSHFAKEYCSQRHIDDMHKSLREAEL